VAFADRTLAYRCGGSAGLAVRRAHHAPASRFIPPASAIGTPEPRHFNARKKTTQSGFLLKACSTAGFYRSIFTATLLAVDPIALVRETMNRNFFRIDGNS
jgi:hypothetical protein